LKILFSLRRYFFFIPQLRNERHHHHQRHETHSHVKNGCDEESGTLIQKKERCDEE
jgi:hypothetical protein